MTDALYQDAILDLARVGAADARLADPDASARLDNPLCGDRVTIDLKLDGDRITAIGHRVQGCALCQASAAIIADQAVGLDAAGVADAKASTRAYLRGEREDAPWTRLSAFAPVRGYKSRHECVLLPFKAAAKAFSGA